MFKENLTMKSANIVAQITLCCKNTVFTYTEILNNLVGNEKHAQTKVRKLRN